MEIYILIIATIFSASSLVYAGPQSSSESSPISSPMFNKYGFDGTELAWYGTAENPENTTQAFTFLISLELTVMTDIDCNSNELPEKYQRTAMNVTIPKKYKSIDSIRIHYELGSMTDRPNVVVSEKSACIKLLATSPGKLDFGVYGYPV